MNWLAALRIVLAIALYFVKRVDRAELDAAEAKGENLGALRAFIQFSDTLDEKIVAAKRAAAGAGGMPDIADDPNNRANRSGKGGTGT